MRWFHFLRKSWYYAAGWKFGGAHVYTEQGRFIDSKKILRGRCKQMKMARKKRQTNCRCTLLFTQKKPSTGGSQIPNEEKIVCASSTSHKTLLDSTKTFTGTYNKRPTRAFRTPIFIFHKLSERNSTHKVRVFAPQNRWNSKNCNCSCP